MRLQWLVYLMLGGLAYGQAAKPVTPAQPAPAAQTAPAAAEKPAEVKVAPTDAVITIKGYCEDASKTGDACKTVVTREEFDKLADALQPNMPPQTRRQLATALARMLPASIVAKQKGLDKEPRFDLVMHFYRVQIMAQELIRSLQTEAANVPAPLIEQYYKDNPAAFEEASLLHIYVPRTKRVAPPKPAAKDAKDANETKPEDAEAQQKAGEEAMKKVAADLRTRAAAGEDFDKLQKEAFAAAGLKTPAPSTKIEKARRTTLPPTQSAVLDLKTGEVSQIIDDPSGHHIYKLVSKQTLPLETVKDEIQKTLTAQRTKDAMQPLQQITPELNESYFGASAPQAPRKPKAEEDND